VYVGEFYRSKLEYHIRVADRHRRDDEGRHDTADVQQPFGDDRRQQHVRQPDACSLGGGDQYTPSVTDADAHIVANTVSNRVADQLDANSNAVSNADWHADTDAEPDCYSGNLPIRRICLDWMPMRCTDVDQIERQMPMKRPCARNS